MTIEKIGCQYIAKGRYNRHYLSAIAMTRLEVIKAIMLEIATYRSLSAWNK